MTPRQAHTQSATLVCAEVHVSGTVQGVGYRSFVEMAASHLKLTGYARNLRDGRVQIEAEGERAAIGVLIKRLWLGPPGADVTDVQVAWRPYGGRFTEFSIRFF